MLAVVAGFVFLTTQLQRRQDARRGADDTRRRSATSAAVAGCTAPPAAPRRAAKVAMPDKATAAGKTFTAVVTTNCGDITLELDGAKAPQTVASFVELAKANYFNDSPCHRVTTDGIFVLQCGDPHGGTGTGPRATPTASRTPPRTARTPRARWPWPAPTTRTATADQFFLVYKDSELPTAVAATPSSARSPAEWILSRRSPQQV